MRWQRGQNKQRLCLSTFLKFPQPYFSSFFGNQYAQDVILSLLFLQNINWNCLHSRFLSDTTSKCLARWERSPNITWDCGRKKRNVFSSITKDSFANFSNTILGHVGEPETLKNDLNRGGWGRIQLLQETISISLQSLKVIEWDWLISRKFRPQNFQFRPNAKDFQEN